MCQRSIRTEEVLDIWSESIRDLGEDTYHLAAFFPLQLSDAVICLYELNRLYIDGLTRGRLVMHDASDLPLVHGAHRDNQSPISQGRLYISLYPALSLCPLEDALEHPREATLRVSQCGAYAEELPRGVVS